MRIQLGPYSLSAIRKHFFRCPLYTLDEVVSNELDEWRTAVTESWVARPTEFSQQTEDNFSLHLLISWDYRNMPPQPDTTILLIVSNCSSDFNSPFNFPNNIKKTCTSF
jgi:hypothetical protein